MNPDAMECLDHAQYLQPARNQLEQLNQDANIFIQEKKRFCDKISSLEFSQTTVQIGQVNEQDKAAQIDEIHADFNTLLDKFFALRDNANLLITQFQHGKNYLEQIFRRACEQYTMLVKEHALVIFQQPDPVLKTGKNIHLILHFLGAEKLGICDQLTENNIFVDIVTEKFADELRKTDQLDPNTITTVDEIDFNRHQSMKIVINKEQRTTIEIKKCKLLSMKKRTSVQQKYALLFRCGPLQIANFNENTLWTVSKSVMVTVHCSQSQKCKLPSEIFWQRAFKSAANNEGEDDEEFMGKAVSWSKFVDAIIHEFTSVTRAISVLTEGDMRYVAEKLFGTNSSDNPHLSITYERFALQRMNDEVELSCYDWIFAIMQLIKQKEVLKFWNQGWIIGFISRRDAESKITTMKGHPTFLLRFSDRVKGAISIVFCDSQTSQTEDSTIKHIHPFTAQDLRTIPLDIRISACPALRYLHTKDERIVHLLISEPSNPLSGYISATWRMVLIEKNDAADTQETQQSPIATGRLPHNLLSIEPQRYPEREQHMEEFSPVEVQVRELNEEPEEVIQPDELQELGPLDDHLFY